MSSPAQQAHLFQLAAQGKREELANRLKQEPELSDASNEQGISLLLWAMYHGQREAAAIVYQHLSAPDLLAAVAVNDLAGIESALATDRQLIAAHSPDGFTALHYACFFGHAEAAKLLINKGAPVDQAAANPSAVCPIHSASASQSNAIVELLLDAGANPNVQQHGGYTALMSAAAHNNVELISLLLANGANKQIKDDEGRDAYDHGKQKGFEISDLKS